MVNKAVILATALLAVFSHTGRAEQHCREGSIRATAPALRYERHDNGTVTDKRTGLMWRTCLEGVAGDACRDGTPLEMSWAGALKYVPAVNREDGFAGHKDWRLPNIRELGTLTELQCTDPAIDLGVFPNAAASGVWSSSPARFHAHYSWYVDFATGAIDYGERIKPKAVRLVRDL